jgi:hypothetical protein
MAELSASEQKKEDWMNSKWRPMMGWMYMGVCMFDFVIAPVMWSLLQSLSHGAIGTQWQPLTLQGAGLFHIAMGAVLGIAAMGRTQEKLAGANNGGISPTPSMPSTPSPTQAGGFSMPTTFSTPSFSAPKPTPITQSPAGNFGGGFGLDPNDPPVRNTRND